MVWSWIRDGCSACCCAVPLRRRCATSCSAAPQKDSSRRPSPADDARPDPPSRARQLADPAPQRNSLRSSPFFSFSVPFAWSARPSDASERSPVSAPPASLTRPFALSPTPSARSWFGVVPMLVEFPGHGNLQSPGREAGRNIHERATQGAERIPARRPLRVDYLMAPCLACPPTTLACVVVSVFVDPIFGSDAI